MTIDEYILNDVYSVPFDSNKLGWNSCDEKKTQME